MPSVEPSVTGRIFDLSYAINRLSKEMTDLLLELEQQEATPDGNKRYDLLESVERSLRAADRAMDVAYDQSIGMDNTQGR
jgi:hypothetical protein